MVGNFTDTLVNMIKNDYVTSTIIFFFFVVIAYVFLSLVKTILSAWAKKTKTTIDDAMIERLEAPTTFFIAVLGLKFALMPLDFGVEINAVMNHFVNSLIIIVATYIIMRLSMILVNEAGKKMKHLQTLQMKTVFPLMQRFINIFVGILGFLFLMIEWGVEVGPFLASLGILGLALSFALKDSLSNIFGGISLILDKNFNVGDVIRLETGEAGQVVNIGIRSTKIKSFDNEVLIVPNTLLSNIKIINLAKPDPTARLVLSIGVDYKSDPNQVKSVLKETIDNLPGKMENPSPIVRFNKMGDYYLEFKIYFWVDDYMQKFEMEDKATMAVWYALKKAKIGIPFPTRTLFMKKAISEDNKNRKKTKKK